MKIDEHALFSSFPLFNFSIPYVLGKMKRAHQVVSLFAEFKFDKYNNLPLPTVPQGLPISLYFSKKTITWRFKINKAVTFNRSQRGDLINF